MKDSIKGVLNLIFYFFGKWKVHNGHLTGKVTVEEK